MGNPPFPLREADEEEEGRLASRNLADSTPPGRGFVTRPWRGTGGGGSCKDWGWVWYPFSKMFTVVDVLWMQKTGWELDAG